MPDYGNLQRPNTQMMQYGMQMLQPRPPGYQNPQPQMQTLPYSGGQPQMQTLPYSGGQGVEQLASPPGGKRRVRIGNKTYVEEDDTATAPSTQIGSRSY